MVSQGLFHPEISSAQLSTKTIDERVKSRFRAAMIYCCALAMRLVFCFITPWISRIPATGWRLRALRQSALVSGSLPMPPVVRIRSPPHGTLGYLLPSARLQYALKQILGRVLCLFLLFFVGFSEGTLFGAAQTPSSVLLTGPSTAFPRGEEGSLAERFAR